MTGQRVEPAVLGARWVGQEAEPAEPGARKVSLVNNAGPVEREIFRSAGVGVGIGVVVIKVAGSIPEAGFSRLIRGGGG